LAEEKDVDAVQIMTLDHLHATIAIAAMNAGKHVAMHKSVANRLVEGRKVLDTVRKTGKATHLIAYGSGEANARIVEQINQGVWRRSMSEKSTNEWTDVTWNPVPGCT
jgi:predicted dehydrogenase